MGARRSVWRWFSVGYLLGSLLREVRRGPLRSGGASVGLVALVGLLVFAPMGQMTAQAAGEAEGIRVVTSVLGGVAAAGPGALTLAASAEATGAAAAAGACVASIVCGGVLLAAAVGVAAYTTRDTWMPWVFKEPPVDPIGPTASPVGRELPGTLNGTTDVVCVGPIVCSNNVYPTITGAGSGSWVAPGWSVTWPGTVIPYVWEGPSNASGGQASAFDAASGHYGAQSMSVYGCSITGGSAEAKASCVVVGTVWAAPYGMHYPPQSEWAPPSGAAATITTTKMCRKSSDGTEYAVQRDTIGFTGAAGLLVGACLPGDRASNIAVDVEKGGTTVRTQSTPLGSTPAEDSKYPQCAQGGCEYGIILDGKQCRVGVSGCSKWYEVQTSQPTRVQGRYGPYEIDAAQLTWMRYAYLSSEGVKIDANTSTGTDPGNLPAPEINTDPMPWGPVPTPVDPPGGPLPWNLTPGQSDVSCFGGTNGISWNPVSWVLVPVKCALVWAFVPSSEMVTDIWAVPQLEFERVGIKPSVDAVTVAVGSLGGSDGGCSGPFMPFNVSGVHINIQPFNACEDPMKTVAGYAYAFVSVTAIFFGAFRVIELVGAGFGYVIPGMAKDPVE